MIPDDIILVNATDTCAVWHLLGAATLFRAARRVNASFIITGAVAYECFVKSRGNPVSPERRLLRDRLRSALDGEQVSKMDVTIEDLQETVDIARRQDVQKRLGQGELSCVALARKLGHAAVLTDNKREFNAILKIVDRLQTTPQLLGWLYVEEHLSDADVDAVVNEHLETGGNVDNLYRDVHVEACAKKLMRRTTGTTGEQNDEHAERES